LVIADVALRKQITAHLNKYNIERFSMIHNQSYALTESIALGCMIYPMASIYPSATVEQDVIVHSLTLVAHKCHVGCGAFISGGITIGGSTTIGDFTQIGINATIYDQINIVADTVIGAATVVRKDILQSGTYSSQSKNKLVRVK
jgi:UDP-3-O-[3-hydroxymyristoyl] glucosamine N-acyltransferase